MRGELNQILHKAWIDRLNQRVELAQQGLNIVQKIADWSDLSLGGLQQLQSERDSYLEALLLKLSIQRANGLRAQSSPVLAKILRYLNSMGEPIPFRLNFELALEYWIDQDTAKALEYFLKANKLARDVVTKVMTESNILWCLEDLDLHRNGAESKLSLLLQDPSLSREDSRHARQLFDAYRLRKQFYREGIVGVPENSGLSDYFHKWCQQLPYVAQKEPQFLDSDYLWQGSYRFRTLVRAWSDEDHHVLRASDAIDRLYLWTWLFMGGRKEVGEDQVVSTLESILRILDIDLLSKENSLLLRNAIGWINVLIPSLRKRLHPIEVKLRKLTTPNYPLLQEEYDWIERIRSDHVKSDGIEDGKIRCPQNKVRKIGRMKAFFSEFEDKLPVLKIRLGSLWCQNQGYDLVVDASTAEIAVIKEKKIVISRVLTDLIIVLDRNESVQIDHWHEPKTQNLVYRARKIFGKDFVSVRRRQVHKGDAWPRILVRNGVAIDLEPKTCVGSQRFISPQSCLQVTKAIFPKKFKRAEVQKQFSVSKATANRLINKWILSGLIYERGHARGKSYLWA